MPDPERLQISPATGHRRPWALVGVLGVVLAVVLAAVLWPQGDRPAPAPSGSTPPSPSRPELSAPPSPRATSTPVGWQWAPLTTEAEVPNDLRLLLTSQRGLVSLDFAKRRVGTFATPGHDERCGSADVVPMADEVMYQRCGSAYLLTNRSTLTPLASPRDQPDRRSVRWYPGPSEHWPLWRIDSSADQPVHLMDLQGHAQAVPLPDGVTGDDVSSDGAGGLLVEGADGTTFLLGPTGAVRVADAPVVAAGPTRLLTTRCDATGDCWYEVVDRDATSIARRIPGDVLPNARGAVSPDGTTAILTVLNTVGSPLVLLDLRTGARRQAGTIDGFFLGLVWAPDSQWIVANTRMNGQLTSGPVLLVDVSKASYTLLTLPGLDDVAGLAIDPFDRPGWR